jgi:hypothetical protein
LRGEPAEPDGVAEAAGAAAVVVAEPTAVVVESSRVDHSDLE